MTDYARFSAVCPICGEHDFIIHVEPADPSVGIRLPGIADVTIEDPDAEPAVYSEHLDTVLDTLYGDDDDASERLVDTLFDRRRY